MGSKSLGPEDLPEGMVPAAVVTRILVGLLLAVGALIVTALLRGCDRPTQMLPSPAATASPEVRAAAKGEGASQATGTQTIKGMLRKRPQVNTPSTSNGAKAPGPAASQVNTLDDDWEFVFEATQTMGVAATSSAQASASESPHAPQIPTSSDHGRLGVIAATMPGILAADVELARVDVPPWMVGMPLELGLDVVANLEAGSLGVSAGSKAFVLVGYWSRWNLSAHGIAVGAGLRF